MSGIYNYLLFNFIFVVSTIKFLHFLDKMKFIHFLDISNDV